MAKRKATTPKTEVSTMEYTFTVHMTQLAGQPNANGEFQNHHVHLVHPEDTSDRSCMQSPLFHAVKEGSIVTITISDPPPGNPPV